MEGLIIEEQLGDSCIDKPRVTDYKFGEMMGADIATPVSIKYINTDVQDQSIIRTPPTTMACTCFSDAHIVTEMNHVEGSFLNVSGEALWNKAIELGANIKGGWYLQSAVDLLVSEGYASGYSSAVTIDDMKKALTVCQLMATGTNKCNWAETLRTNIFTPGSSYGHAFCIVGYDDDKKWFIAKNSYGPNRYDKGYFYIPYEHIDKLFTRYAIVDKANEDLVLKHKTSMDDQMIRLTIENGIMNGTNLESPITRREAAIVIGRLITLLKK